MDDVDLQLMRRMGVAPFLAWPHPPASLRPAALGRALKISTDTVKRRLAALSKAGVFHGTRVFPNPRLFGLQMASFHFRMGEATRRRVPPAAVAAVPGVLGVFDMVGGDRCVDVAFPDHEARERLRTELSGLLGATSSHFVDYATPAPARDPTPLDWRLLQALRAAPGTTVEQAAEAVGVSARTGKRRFDRMVKEGHLDVIGLFDPGALKGHLLVDLVFHFRTGAGPADVPTVLNAFRSRWVAQWTPPDHRLGHLALVVVAGSARELEDLRREGESLACVDRCDPLVIEGALERWDWLDAEIAKRAALQARPPAAAREAATFRPRTAARSRKPVQKHARRAR